MQVDSIHVQPIRLLKYDAIVEGGKYLTPTTKKIPTKTHQTYIVYEGLRRDGRHRDIREMDGGTRIHQ